LNEYKPPKFGSQSHRHSPLNDRAERIMNSTVVGTKLNSNNFSKMNIDDSRVYKIGTRM
jgi:3D (Asp-Asp-Asp) domain-containing protein